MRRLALAAALCAGCNTFIGVDDVRLRPDGGGDDQDGAIDALLPDAAPDAAVGRPVGFADEFSGSADITPDADFARKITIAQDTELLRFGVVTKSPSTAQIRMGLYADDAGKPGSFVARTSVFDLSGRTDGRITIDGPAGTLLMPGDYWVAIAANLATPIGKTNTLSSDSCFISRPFASSMPTTGGFGSSPTCNVLDAVNLFIEVTP